jgi:hypothetical protein
MKADTEMEELLKISKKLIGGQICSFYDSGRPELYGEIIEVVGQVSAILASAKIPGKGEFPFYLPRHYRLLRENLGGRREFFIAWSLIETERKYFKLVPKIR